MNNHDTTAQRRSPGETAAEVLDSVYVKNYGDVALGAIDAYYGEIGRQVDEVYAAIGSRVVRGVSYAGEDPTRLFAPRV